MKQFDIITIFPKILDSYFKESILGRAQYKKLIKINTINLRDYTTDNHKSVDDTPYGGGAGMLMMVPPFAKALKAIKKKKKNRIIMLAPAGKTFTQKDAIRLSKYDQLIFLAGRYEGFDARIEKLVDEKISIGDYVLSGGELAAAVIVEAVARNVSGVLGNNQTIKEESFSVENVLEYPQYTRPETFQWQIANGKWQTSKVPKVLLSGNHAEIKKWRIKNSKKRR